MAFEDLKTDIEHIDANLRAYLEHGEAHLKLKGFKILMRLITSFAQSLLVGAVALLAFFILSISAAFGIGQWIGNVSFGFAIVGIALVIIGGICFVLKDKLNKPILRRFSRYYFDQR